MAVQPGLSQRERQIAQSYAAGPTYQAIATTLCIAPSTVRTHLATIYRKLQVSLKIELAAHLNGQALQARRTERETAAIVSELALSLEEAISREKVHAEVMRIIGAVRGDLNRVRPPILTYGLELCDTEFGILLEYRKNGQFMANHSVGIPFSFKTWLDEQGAFSLSAATGLGRIVNAHAVVNNLDINSEAIFQTDDPLRRATADLGNARSFVAIPMLAGAILVGAFTIYRKTVRPFSEDTTRLAQVFAAQNVIALENARMVRAMQTVRS